MKETSLFIDKMVRELKRNETNYQIFQLKTTNIIFLILKNFLVMDQVLVQWRTLTLSKRVLILPFKFGPHPFEWLSRECKGNAPEPLERNFERAS